MGANRRLRHAHALPSHPLATAEQNALIDFYNSTGGPNWVSHNGWNTATDGCTWQYVTCIAGHVTRINLFRNNVTGTLPDSIGILRYLNSLSIVENQLGGSIPASVGNLSQLRALSFSSNRMTGTIPSSIGNLSALESLILHDNGLSGTIPDTLGNLTSLKTLWADYNQISGSIPASFGNLVSLTSLDFQHNRLTGEIPAGLGNLSGLLDLTLSHNQLSGGIPASLGQTVIRNLYLDDNQLTGEIPASLGNLHGLLRLFADHNQLTGAIPASLGQTGIFFLHLENNQLSGPLPPELGNLHINYLYLNNNSLSGEIPNTILNMKRDLSFLDVDFNYLTTSNPDVKALIDKLNPDWEYTQGYGCVLPSGIDVCRLENGDILLERVHTGDTSVASFPGSYWSHAALYNGHGRILQAANANDGVELKAIASSSFYSATDAVDWTVLRIPLYSYYHYDITGAVAWATSTAGNDAIGFMPAGQWLDAGNKSQEQSFYSSLFIWRAFFNQGLDLDFASGYLAALPPGSTDSAVAQALLAQVLPDDLYASAIGTNDIPAVTAIAQDKDPTQVRSLWALLSPADLIVHDSDGNIVNTSPSAFYSGAGSEPEWLASSDVAGNLTIEVQGTGSGSYTLGMQVLGASGEKSDAFQWETTPGQMDTFSATSDTSELAPVDLGNEAVAIGTVQLQGRAAAPNDGLQVPVQITITQTGETDPVFDAMVTLDTQGQFAIHGLYAGTYRIRVKGEHTLSAAQTVTLTAGNNTVQVGALKEGDTDGNNIINLTDFSILAATFGKQTGNVGFDARADFNGDGVVNLTDFSLLATNFGQSGAN